MYRFWQFDLQTGRSARHGWRSSLRDAAVAIAQAIDCSLFIFSHSAKSDTTVIPALAIETMIACGAAFAGAVNARLRFAASLIVYLLSIDAAVSGPLPRLHGPPR